MRRQSTSSASSVSTTSTAVSYSKPEVLDTDLQKPETIETQEVASSAASVTTLVQDKGKDTDKKRRGLRQRARDVVSDIGAPPTRRQDAKDGKHTSNFGDLGLLAEGIMKPGKV